MRGYEMKKLFYRLPSSRSFTRLLSILTLAIVAFAALDLFFVQQALAGNLCCKIGTSGCPSGTGATSVALSSTNHYCEGSSNPAVCNSTSYRFEKVSVAGQLRNKTCYPTVNPPQDSASFTLSGPLTVCQFYRPDLKDVQVIADSLAFGDEDAGPGPHVVSLGGVAVCGIPDTDRVLRNFAYFALEATHNCVFRNVSGNGDTFTYEQLFTDFDPRTTKCPDGSDPVSGFLKGKANPSEPPLPPPVGDISRMLTYCTGGTPEEEPAPGGVADCLLNIGIEVGINANFFETRVCPKDPSTGRTVDGQTFAFTEKLLTNGEFRPGQVSTCSCQSDLDGGAVDCGQGNTGESINSNTAGATECEFDWSKTGTPSGDTLNLTGKNQVNGAIFDSPECPVNAINRNTLRVCNNVTPRQIKIGTAQGRPALSFQISEPACVATLQGLVAGDTRLIYVTGTFNDTTRFVGTDDVLVVGD
jgi:hypothetical protein